MAEDENSFFMSLRPLFVLGQISGVFPLTGTTSNRHEDLKFNWKNWQIIYIIIIFLSTIFFNVCSTIDNLSDGIRLDNFGSTIFYTVCILNCVFFVKIARDLPQLCHQIYNMEISLMDYGLPTEINKRIKIFLYTFLSMSIVEHGLLTWLNIKGAIENSVDEKTTFLESFYETRFPVILGYTGHSDFMVIFVFFINVICTFNWNYLDYFLICVSMEISGKFTQISKFLETEMPKNWSKISSDYNKLSITAKLISGKISKLVFMSYCSNLYHISLQLLRSLRFQGDANAKVYFYFSMIYLILRTLFVSLQAAKIPDESQEPKKILYALKTLPPGAKRFLNQVLTDDINITGLRFFAVNRKFIITLIATLITYEVILLQFNSLRYENKRL